MIFIILFLSIYSLDDNCYFFVLCISLACSSSTLRKEGLANR